MVQPRPRAPTTLDDVAALLRENNRILSEIFTGLIPPRRSEQQQVPEGLARRIVVTTAGTPVQGPDVKINRGYGVVVRQRNHTVGAPIGYVGFTQGDVLNTNTRIETLDGDSFVVRISNFNKLWFNADTNDTLFEIFVEM